MTSKAFAFLNDLGFNYSLCPHAVLSDSSRPHPVNELSGSTSPVEAFLLVRWVAGGWHLCQRLTALICTREEGCPVPVSGAWGEAIVLPWHSLTRLLLLFVAFFSFFLFFFLTSYASIPVCLRVFFFFSYLETDLLRFAQKLSLV